jgi:pimeloyl-[acyl-carrier protein] synthase
MGRIVPYWALCTCAKVSWSRRILRARRPRREAGVLARPGRPGIALTQPVQMAGPTPELKGTEMSNKVASALDDLLVSPGFYQDPYPIYDELRAQVRVAWSEALGGWLIPRYDDVLATMLDVKHFSSQGRVLAVLNRYEPEVRAQFQTFESHFSSGLINADPPNHTRLRALVNYAFTPRTVERLRGRVQELVDDLIDARLEYGTMDLIRDFAYPLPAIITADILGVPRETREDFQRWSDGVLAFQGKGYVPPAALAEAQTNLIAMREFLAEHLEARRKQPSDDLLSHLVEAEMEGDRLTPAELLTTCVTLLIAGHETTTNFLSSGMYTLMKHPEQMERLRNEPSLLPTAVEEMLRFEGPLQRNPRRMSEDYEYGGALLRKGDYVLQMMGAANRDENQFPNHNQFDITRTPNRHVAFGFGIHFCVGAPLARMEAPIAVGTLLRRMPNMRLAADNLEWRPHGLLRGLWKLPVNF